jgi:thiol-disulfide isomerase/thioredoxin
MPLFRTPFLAACLVAGASLRAQEMQFHHGDWSSALELAAREHKLVFLDAFTTWCGPCRMMDRQTFRDPRVAAFFNQTFINVKMDMEKGEGLSLARQYQIQAYPTLLFIDPAGEVIHRVAGFHDPDQFLQLGQTALDPSSTLRGWELRFLQGDRDPDFLHDYAYRRYQSMDGSHYPVALAYIEGQTDWSLPRNLEFIFNFAEYLDDRFFPYLVRQRTQFEKHFGSIAVLRKIEEVIETASFLNEPDWDQTAALLREVFPRDAERQLLFVQMNHFQQKEDMESYVATTLRYFKRFPSDDADVLNDAAWTFYERVDDPKALREALKWAQKAVKLEDDYYNNDTLAALYAKLGKKKQARKVAFHAIGLAKASGLDHSLTTELLESL